MQKIADEQLNALDNELAKLRGSISKQTSSL